MAGVSVRLTLPDLGYPIVWDSVKSLSRQT